MSTLFEILTGKKKGYDVPVWMRPKVGEEAEKFKEIAYGDLPKKVTKEPKKVAKKPKKEGAALRIVGALVGAKKKAVVIPPKKNREQALVEYMKEILERHK